MTAKWIDDVYEATYGMSGDMWKDVLEILLRINTLLCIAGSETDNEFLHDDIQEEVQNV